jgi:hypothetical protein
VIALRILALDVATKMGVADGEPGSTPALATVNLGRELDVQADVFCRASLWITRRLLSEPPDLVVLEQPVGVHDSSLLMGLRGIMLGLVRAHDVKVIEVAIATWRLYSLLAGNLPGKVAKARAVALCERLGWNAPDHNAAEAAGIWLWACAKAAPRLVPRHEPLFLGATTCRSI